MNLVILILILIVVFCFYKKNEYFDSVVGTGLIGSNINSDITPQGLLQGVSEDDFKLAFSNSLFSQYPTFETCYNDCAGYCTTPDIKKWLNLPYYQCAGTSIILGLKNLRY